MKGAWLGLALVLILGGLGWARGETVEDWASTMAWVLLIPTVTSFVAMNFTGASTYTSLSGVRREMRVAVPLQTAAVVMGAGLWLMGRFT